MATVNLRGQMLGGWLNRLPGETLTPGAQICNMMGQIISIFSRFDAPASLALAC